LGERATVLDGDDLTEYNTRTEGGIHIVRGLQLAGGDLEMETRTEEQERGEPEAETLLERSTLCMPDFEKDTVSHCGDDGFKSVLQQYFRSPESNAAERLVKLKDRLRPASTHDFWTILMEEMCAITGAQCGFVAKRILVDDENTAVEMPPLGEPGSCLLGVAFYLNDGHDFNQMYHDYRYHAYGR
jgi:hypothetical protein